MGAPEMDESARAADWWTTLYDDTLADMLLVRRNAEELRTTIAFLRTRGCAHPNGIGFQIRRGQQFRNRDLHIAARLLHRQRLDPRESVLRAAREHGDPREPLQ